MSTGYHSVVYGPFKTPRTGSTLGVNPLPGRNERAVVDVDTGRASGGSDPVDPFEVEP